MVSEHFLILFFILYYIVSHSLYAAYSVSEEGHLILTQM